MRFLVLAFAVVVAGVASPAATAAPPKLEIVAKLADKPKAGICGVRAVWAIVRYEVETVVAGDYAPKNLYVGVLCPETLVVGARYRLGLEPLPAKHPYTDTYGEPALPRFHAAATRRL